MCCCQNPHSWESRDVTWRVPSMAALSWGSSSTGRTVIAWFSLAFPCHLLIRRTRPKMTAWERSGNKIERCNNTGHRSSSSSTRSRRQKTAKPRACFCPGRWRKSSRIRRWRGASTASCVKPVRWRSVSGFVMNIGSLSLMFLSRFIETFRSEVCLYGRDTQLASVSNWMAFIASLVPRWCLQTDNYVLTPFSLSIITFVMLISGHSRILNGHRQGNMLT